MRHFATKKEAVEFRDSLGDQMRVFRVFKKVKGMNNRIKKPFLVGTEFEWLNQY